MINSRDIRSIVQIFGMLDRPLQLSRYVAILNTGGDGEGVSLAELDAMLTELVETESEARRAIQFEVIKWDGADPNVGEWTEGTEPSTLARRRVIYELLGVSESLRASFDSRMPIFVHSDTVEISEDFVRWYDDNRKLARWYWPRYEEYLSTKERWDPENLHLLDQASDRVLERLADPYSQTPRPTRGLVVGYVQSGKTANMTAVIAKAVDAGYRLIILLSGTTNLLRNQTQRRLDKQLIGVEIINGQGPVELDDEYVNDDDYAEFQRYGSLPSLQGSVDWYRITTSRDDFKQVHAHLAALNVNRAYSAKPPNHPDNLAVQPAILIVAKKNPSVLKKLNKALRRTSDAIVGLPTIVLDDESDHASINTTRPTRDEVKKRTTINGLIVKILDRLKQAQYVGYTATPFANVFIDPDDAEDLFPRHFLVSLPRPRGYMGAAEFHDLEGVDEDRQGNLEISNRAAFIRNVVGEDELDGNLPAAIDAFVLSGAIKLFREEETRGTSTPLRFKHHTMLMHTSSLQADHADDEMRVIHQLNEAAYEGGDGEDRLRRRLEDFREVSVARAADLPFPDTYGELKPFIGQMLDLLRGDGSPVAIVNSSESDPDFEQGRVWKILVGGNKLSRGYTVAGLTISYFRRRPGSADTLMQMGRWFGYRLGYEDLVRLYVGTAETTGRGTTTYDLCEGFEGLLQTEEEFRQELERFALSDDGAERLTPRQLPPLVSSHVPWLRPVAANKMWNVRLVRVNFGEAWYDPTLAPKEPADVTHNARIFEQLLERLSWSDHELVNRRDRMRALVSEATPAQILGLIGDDYRWIGDTTPARHRLFLEFLDGEDENDPAIDRWVIIAPQLRSPRYSSNLVIGNTVFSVKHRTRALGGRVKAYTEPVHKRLAEYVTGYTGDGQSPQPNMALSDLREDRTAVLLFYPVRHKPDQSDMSPITMGFSAWCPPNRMPRSVQFQVRSRGDSVVVDLSRSNG